MTKVHYVNLTLLTFMELAQTTPSTLIIRSKTLQLVDQCHKVHQRTYGIATHKEKVVQLKY